MNDHGKDANDNNNNAKPDPPPPIDGRRTREHDIEESIDNEKGNNGFHFGDDPFDPLRVGATHRPIHKSSRNGRVAGPDFKDQVRATIDSSAAANLTPTEAPKSSQENTTPAMQDLENPTASDNLISAQVVVEPSLPATIYQAHVLDQGKEIRQRRCLWMLGSSLAVFIVVSIAGGVGAYFGLNKNRNSAPSPEALTMTSASPTTKLSTVSPTIAPVVSATTTPTVSRALQIETIIFDILGSRPEPDSAQDQALDWLITMDQADNGGSLLSNDRLITRFALATFYYAANGPKWVSQANFLSPTRHECDWNIGAIGIDCSSLLTVTAISLVNNRLGGTLATELGLLSSLEILMLRGDVRNRSSVNVSSNFVRGTIPTELKNLSNLIQLDLSQNGGFNGTIPTEITQLDALVELRLNDNELTGLVPSEIGTMSSLTLVDLSNNALTGAAPTSLDNIRCATLGGNMLTTCFFRRSLQASSNRSPEDCFNVLPPCGLPSSSD